MTDANLEKLTDDECPRCNGTGAEAIGYKKDFWTWCIDCRGTGKQSRRIRDGEKRQGEQMITDPDTKNNAFKGAFRKGVQAYRDGKQLQDNPYKYTPGKADTPHACHITWVRAFHGYWRDGFEMAKRDKEREG